jgi:hypothetical protein
VLLKADKRIHMSLKAEKRLHRAEDLVHRHILRGEAALELGELLLVEQRKSPGAHVLKLPW